jgi:hypothetical protein
MRLTTGSNLQNPDSVRFLTSFIITAGTDTVATHATITYTAANIATASVANTLDSAGSPNTMTFTFQITNPIPQGGKIQIIWPTQVQFKQASATGLVSISIYGVTQSTFTTTVTQSFRTFVFDGLFTGGALAVSAQNIVIAIQQLNNPESQVASDSFAYTTFDSSNNEIDKVTTGLTVASTQPGIITLTSITPNPSTVDAQLTVQMLETTDISTTNAFLRVYWPSEVTYLTSGTLTCSFTLGFTANTPPCTVDLVNNYLELSFYRSDFHLYTVGTFQNPLGAITTSTWKFEVYDSTTSLLMQKITGITYTTTASAITVTTSTRPSSLGNTIGLQADYSLVFTTSTRMLSDSIIQIVFPVDQVLYNASTTCENGSATDLGCTFTDVNSTHFKTEITQWCNTGAE